MGSTTPVFVITGPSGSWRGPQVWGLLDLLRQGVRTRDLGGEESTDSFTAAVAAEVARRVAEREGPSTAT